MTIAVSRSRSSGLTAPIVINLLGITGGTVAAAGFRLSVVAGRFGVGCESENRWYMANADLRDGGSG